MTFFIFLLACAAVASACQAQGDADLAAGRAGEELAEGDQVCVTALGQPAASGDKLVAEVTQMCDGAAEGGQPQAQEDQEN